MGSHSLTGTTFLTLSTTKMETPGVVAQILLLTLASSCVVCDNSTASPDANNDRQRLNLQINPQDHVYRLGNLITKVIFPLKPHSKATARPTTLQVETTTPRPYPVYPTPYPPYPYLPNTYPQNPYLPPYYYPLSNNAFMMTTYPMPGINPNNIFGTTYPGYYPNQNNPTGGYQPPNTNNPNSPGNFPPGGGAPNPPTNPGPYPQQPPGPPSQGPQNPGYSPYQPQPGPQPGPQPQPQGPPSQGSQTPGYNPYPPQGGPQPQPGPPAPGSQNPGFNPYQPPAGPPPLQPQFQQVPPQSQPPPGGYPNQPGFRPQGGFGGSPGGYSPGNPGNYPYNSYYSTYSGNYPSYNQVSQPQYPPSSNGYYPQYAGYPSGQYHPSHRNGENSTGSDGGPQPLVVPVERESIISTSEQFLKSTLPSSSNTPESMKRSTVDNVTGNELVDLEDVRTEHAHQENQQDTADGSVIEGLPVDANNPIVTDVKSA